MHRFDFKTIQNVQNIQHNTKLQKWSNYNELHRFDVKTKERKTTKLRRKTFQTTQNNESDHIIIIASIWRQNDQNFWVRWQNYKSNQITMNCIDLMSKRSKMLSYVAKHSKQRKTTKLIKLQCIATIWSQNDLKSWVTSQNYKSDQITMNCIDLTSKLSKMLSYIAKHSKQRKTTKRIKLQWIASIWCQNDQKCWVTSQNIQNNAKLQKWSNYNELHRFEVKTIQNCSKHSTQRKTTKVIKLQWIASIWRQNYQKCWVTSQNIQNNAKVQNGSNYNELHRFDVKTIKNVELRRKTFKTTQNYESDQITMNCIDLTSKR